MWIFAVILRAVRGLRLFECRMQRGMFGLKRDGITGVWTKLYNEECHNFYCSLSITSLPPPPPSLPPPPPPPPLALPPPPAALLMLVERPINCTGSCNTACCTSVLLTVYSNLRSTNCTSNGLWVQTTLWGARTVSYTCVHVSTEFSQPDYFAASVH